MEAQERDLILEMQRDPRSEDAKVRYEQFLAQTRPDSVELELLRRERELAESCSDPIKFDRLVDDYTEFRIEHSYYFWDRRAGMDYLDRSFKVWLVSVQDSRRFAVEMALKMVLDLSIDLDAVPAVIVEETSPIGSRETKENILGFVRRYKGPTGREPELQKDEVVLTVTPSWVTHLESS